MAKIATAHARASAAYCRPGKCRRRNTSARAAERDAREPAGLVPCVVCSVAHAADLPPLSSPTRRLPSDAPHVRPPDDRCRRPDPRSSVRRSSPNGRAGTVSEMDGSGEQAGRRPPDVVVVGAGGHALVVIDVLRAAGRRVAGCVTERWRRPSRHRPARRDDARSRRRPRGAVGDGTGRHLRGDRRQPGPPRRHATPDRGRRPPRRRRQPGGDRVLARLRRARARSSCPVPSSTRWPASRPAPSSTPARPSITSASSASSPTSAPGVALAGDVTIGTGALVGIGAAVTPGRRVGAWSTVGAGATVVADVADGTVVVGTPARELPAR